MASKEEFVFSGHETFHAEQGKEPDTRMSLSHSIRFEIIRMVMERWGIWIYGPLPSFQGSEQKQVVSQLPLARPFSFLCGCLVFSFGCVSLVYAS